MMIVLHAAFDDSKFYIWAEKSFETRSIIPYATRSRSPEKIYRLPWTADEAQIYDVLRSTGIFANKSEEPTESGSAIKAYITVPTQGGIPLASSPLLGELPPTEGETELEVFQIDAVAITYGALVSLTRFLDGNGERLTIPGVVFSEDLRYVCNTVKYASLMVMRGNFLPDMDEGEQGYFSVWRPLYRGKYHDELTGLVKSVPSSLRGFYAHKGLPRMRTKTAAALSMLETLLDGVARNAQNTVGVRGKKVDADNPHEIWLRSLSWQKSTLDKWNEEMEVLHRQIRAWRDSIMSVTGQPWRLLLRVEEPAERGGGEKKWSLTWHLQSVGDPSLVVPASRVWSPGPAERQWFATIDSNPRRYLLQVLGQLASNVPAVAKSLYQQCPLGCELNLDELFAFLHDHVPAVLDQGVNLQLPTAWGQFEDRPRLAVKGSVSNDTVFSTEGQFGLEDLLNVDWSVSLGDDVLTMEELEMLTQLKTPLTQVRGKWVLLSRKELENIIDGLKKLPERVNRRDALLFSIKENYKGLPLSGISGSKWLDSVRAILTGREPLAEVEQPAGFRGELRPYQLRGLSWLSWLTKLGLGGCLADDMGLGKTIQTLALLKKIELEGETRPILLICPTSVMENWRREAERFVPDMKVMIQHGTKRLRGEKFISASKKYRLFISSYALLHRDSSLYSKINWAGVILDEAQNIKNPDTRQSKTAYIVPGDWRIALTGTPVENHVGDMWSIMEFLVPGLLPNRSRFSREFLRPIQAGHKDTMERIKRITGPFILRRLKSDKEIISDLPDKIESTVFCSLTREQASLYNAVLKSLDDKITAVDGIKRKGLVLSAITSLKQLCNHPALYLKDHSDLGNRSGKLTRLAEIAEEMLSTDDRALVFTQYAEMGALLKKYLQETFGREALFLHGGVERQKRDSMVQRFQNDKDAPPFFVLSLRTGGTGLNLTRANQVIMFDRWWNPAVEQQAVDRAYRIGQDRSVQVHYFCCKGTLEEKIEGQIQSKKAVAEAVVGVGENWLADLSDDDLRELFALGSDVVEDVK